MRFAHQTGSPSFEREALPAVCFTSILGSRKRLAYLSINLQLPFHPLLLTSDPPHNPLAHFTPHNATKEARDSRLTYRQPSEAPENAHVPRTRWRCDRNSGPVSGTRLCEILVTEIATSRTAHNTTAWPLLCLPAELRDEIWKLAFNNKMICVHSDHKVINEDVQIKPYYVAYDAVGDHPLGSDAW